jgi:predicted permease
MFEEEPAPQSMSDLHLTNVTIASPGYFRAMAIPLLAGRHLSMQDNETSEPVVIVNDTWVKAYSPDRDPIGRRIRVFDFEVLRRVVGVVGDVRHSNLIADPTPIIYGPYHQSDGSREMALAVLTSGTLDATVTSARNTIRSIDPGAPIYDIRPLSQVLSDAVSAPRFTAILVALFSAIALAMASVGLYGVIRYSVNQRVREIGVRVALGAGRGEIIRLILGKGLMLTTIGIAIGLMGAIGLTRLIRTQLYNVSPTDPLTLLMVALLLAAISMAASLLPAYRATRVDPVRALRQE